MVVLNKEASKLIDNRMKRKEKEFYKRIEDFNLQAVALHKRLFTKVDREQYKVLSDYVNQYIAHTHIWDIRFITNLREFEVATMQMLHFHFIFEKEPLDTLTQERKIYHGLLIQYPHLHEYVLKQFDLHYPRMVALLV
ncbi:hypothetical protein [Caryophanon tenue]|uniref:Uncharacterized protein n=1 Tax=Caryophanon tenue TaxID=33978 RepID=A0A1C0YNE5_9BACL|nr:hypothetical protein [Caryophanon tenue]OCS88695.1 hypothetical protein A6M13_02285 [Caryophanon tenue]